MQRLKNSIKETFLPQNVAPYAKTLLAFVIIGYIIRALMMPLFASGDLISISGVALYLRDTHQLVPTGDPPLIFYMLSSIYSFFGSFLNLNYADFASQTAYTPAGLSTFFRIPDPNFIALISISKIPYLIFDFGTAFLLLHLVNDGRKATLAFKLWMINPFTLYICYAIGQYDIIPTFFLLLAVFFFMKQRTSLSMLSIGIASAFKMFALIFLPFLIVASLKQRKGISSRVKSFFLILALACVPIAMSQASLLLVPPGYQSINAALPSNFEYNGYIGQTLYSRGAPQTSSVQSLFTFFLEYSASLKTYSLFNDTIYLVVFAYGLLLLAVVYFEGWSFDKIYKIILAFLLIYYSVSLFHVQWFLWVQPFLILLVVSNRKFLVPYLLLMPLYFIYSWYWDPGLTAYLLTPINNYSIHWTGPLDFINNLGISGFQFVSIFRSLFSAVCIFIAAVILKKSIVDLRKKDLEMK
jgi:hypothetical protein